MDLRPLGGRLIMINVLRRNLVYRKTLGFDLHHGQLPLLELIIDNPGCTQQQIAERLKVTPASIAQSTTRLQRAGMIEKQVDPENKRCNRLLATQTGKQAALLYRKSFDEVDAQTFAGMSDEELTLLKKLMDHMICNINDNGTGYIPFPFWKGEPPKCSKS